MTQSEQRDWHVLWGEGDLTLRLRSGAQIGEDASGEIRFLPSSEGCWIEFTIDDEHNLWVSPVGGSHQLALGENDLANRVMLDPGTQIKLPNNSLHISTSMQRCASSDVSITLKKIAESDEENVGEETYRQIPLFGDVSRSSQPVHQSSTEQPNQATLEDPVPFPLTRFKWFLIGPLLGAILLIGMTIWNAMEPMSR